ncbi:hypothetical protein [Methanogenium organophilum]|uniref:Uncharacterized protein n=1 Tax=Methanogenium organophilum TaxID=2199 RepID=A0A9X9T713_METOG|nr:hypothetical protein [Methanogenium organophilum]WAI00549.1 hypothetical protein OU421_08915 [Methanogenium organophilum]
MDSNTKSAGSTACETKASVTLSTEERDAINTLFRNFIRVSKHDDYYISEDLLLHLAEQGSTESEAIDNLMSIIMEHLTSIKKIKSQKDEFSQKFREMVAK